MRVARGRVKEEREVSTKAAPEDPASTESNPTSEVTSREVDTSVLVTLMNISRDAKGTGHTAETADHKSLLRTVVPKKPHRTEVMADNKSLLPTVVLKKPHHTEVMGDNNRKAHTVAPRMAHRTEVMGDNNRNPRMAVTDPRSLTAVLTRDTEDRDHDRVRFLRRLRRDVSVSVRLERSSSPRLTRDGTVDPRLRRWPLRRPNERLCEPLRRRERTSQRFAQIS